MQADDAFLSEIIREPDLDEPRLVYADWLQARNEFRAEFIRQQCELAGTTFHDARRVKLAALTSQAQAQFERLWSAPLRGMVQSVEFSRGFVEHVSLDVRSFVKHRERLFRSAPIRSVVFRADSSSPLQELAACPEMTKVRELAFTGDEGVDGLSYVLSAPSMQTTESLTLAPGTMSLETLDALAAAPAVPALKHLDVRQTLLSATAIGELLAYPIFERLESIQLGPLPLAERPFPIALELSPILNRLSALELSMCQLAPAGLRELFHYCTSPSTSILRVPRNALGWQGVRALREAPFVSMLVELDLSSCQLNSRGMATLATLPIRQLRYLHLNHNLIDHRGARELAEASILNGLFELHLQGTQSRLRQGNFKLGDAGFAALMENGLRQLRSLDVARNELRDSSINTLLESPRLDQLVILNLGHNDLGDRAAQLLMDHGPWRDLVMLKLDNNPITPPTRDKLRRVFGPRVSF